MRSLLVGIFAGLVLSTLRAPLGLELLQLPATAPGAAMAFRAGALLAIAVGLILGFRAQSQHFSPFGLLIGTAAGFQAHWQAMDTPSPVLVQGLFSVLLVSLLVAGHTGGPEVRPRKLRIVFLALAALIGWYLIDLGHPEGHAEAVLLSTQNAKAFAQEIGDRILSATLLRVGQPPARAERRLWQLPRQ